MMDKDVNQVLTWYLENKRDLPWRRDHDPYHVWISEVMLQQTRIEAVIGYYERFIQVLPTIFELANVSEEKLLKLWEGLGYYNRARNLKRTAQIIINQYKGIFPSTYDELIILPGIGEYTASAIASICFQEKCATVDGNVLRVYTRFFNDYANISLKKEKVRIRRELEQIMPNKSGDFNEALMEIGEVICVPKGMPNCGQCPLRRGCLARKEGTYFDLPVKDLQNKKKELDYTILIFRYQNKIAIRKRKDGGILAGLWEFPNLEGNYSMEELRHYLTCRGISYQSITKFVSHIHIFTHQKWKMISYLIDLTSYIDYDLMFQEVEVIQNHYAIPTAFRPFLSNL